MNLKPTYPLNRNRFSIVDLPPLTTPSFTLPMDIRSYYTPVSPHKKRRLHDIDSWLDDIAHIYAWTTPDGLYVGQSVCVDKRIAAEGSAGYTCPTGLRDAIRTHGREACTVEIIDECAARDLDARERYWIHTLDTYRTGLNRTRGGQGRATRAISTIENKEAAASTSPSMDTSILPSVNQSSGTR